MNERLRGLFSALSLDSVYKSILGQFSQQNEQCVSEELKFRLRLVESEEDALKLWATHHKELAKCKFILSHPGRGWSRVPVRKDFGRARVLSLFAGDSQSFLDDDIWRMLRRSRSPAITVDYIISFDANSASYLPRLFAGEQGAIYENLRALIQYFGGQLNFDVLPYLCENTFSASGLECSHVLDTLIAAHRLANLDLARLSKSGELVSLLSELELKNRAEGELTHFQRWLAKGGLRADLRWRHQAMHAQVLKMALLHIKRPHRQSAAKNLRAFIEFQHEKLHTLMIEILVLACEWFTDGPRSGICSRLQKNAPHLVATARNISWDLVHMINLRQQVVFPTRSNFIIPYFLTFDRDLAELLTLCTIKSCLISPEFRYPLIYPQHDPGKLLAGVLKCDDNWNVRYLSKEAHVNRLSTLDSKGRPMLDELLGQMENELAAFGR